MTVIQLLLFLVGFVIVAVVLYWTITKFFAPPIQMPILAVVGVLLLIVLLYMFLPEVASTRIWK